MIEVQGTYDERFAGVAEALAATLGDGRDVGASAAVTVDGELVADVWGGYVDEAKTTPWEQDTIINVWSTTKTMCNLTALVLAGSGDLDLDRPVAAYWPEFKAGGKGEVLVRHLLSHSSGLSGWQEPIGVDDLYDWDKATSLLAAQEPWWVPGSASGYHAITQGYLVGEVVRRVTGQTIGTWFADEIAGPLGADFHIGTDPEHDDRVVPVIPPSVGLGDATEMADRDSVVYRTFANPALSAEASWTTDWRRAEIPAAGGHGNARSVALVQSVLSNRGEARGVRLLSEAACDRVFEEQTNGTDLVLGVPIRFGMGYGLGSDLVPLPPRACFWGGWGGSIVVNDLDARMTVTYVMNRMGEGTTGDTRGFGVILAAYQGLQ